MIRAESCVLCRKIQLKEKNWTEEKSKVFFSTLEEKYHYGSFDFVFNCHGIFGPFKIVIALSVLTRWTNGSYNGIVFVPSLLNITELLNRSDWKRIRKLLLILNETALFALCRFLYSHDAQLSANCKIKIESYRDNAFLNTYRLFSTRNNDYSFYDAYAILQIGHRWQVTQFSDSTKDQLLETRNK